MNKKQLLSLGVIILVALLAFTLGTYWSSPTSTTETIHDDDVAAWTCSMHPEISLSQKGRCPLCGMDLIPKGKKGSARHDESVVALTPRDLLRLDLATDTVRAGSGGAATVRLYGSIESDPSLEKVVISRVEGRIEKFYGATPGKSVKKGDPIATIYSTQLYQLLQELKALRSDAGSSAQAIAESSMKQFALLGFSAAEVEKLLTDPSGGERITIRADRGGVVTESMVREGMQVMMGEPLVKITDLTKPTAVLWLYEKEFSLIKQGTAVTIYAESVPGKVIATQVISIDPMIDPMTRSARARVAIPAGSGLIPGMSVTAELSLTQQSTVSIPASAPLVTGTRALVYVETGRSDSGATFEAREILLGAKTGDRYTVVSGLSAGEKIVVRGAFFLDSELQIRGGKSLLSPKREMTTMPKERAQPLAKSVPIAKTQSASAVIPLYLPLWKALSEDNFSESQVRWNKLNAQKGSFSAVVAAIFDEPTPKDMEAMRTQFSKLTSAIIASAEKLPSGAKITFCPMAFGSGASWIQTGDTIANPYYGKKMLRCGNFTGGSK